jgi:hypothetical protein
MPEFPPALKSRLTVPGVLRAPALIRFLEATVDAYLSEVPGIWSIVLFGGITLGEFHPRFSDVDLAIVFEEGAPEAMAGLPDAVRAAICQIPLFSETHVQAKHVGSNVLNAMQGQDWQTWAASSAGYLVTESPYPFTLCDTWLVHNRGLTLAGSGAKDRFPFANAAPTHRDVELARLEWFASRLALPKPFGGLSGLDLAGEFIYYGTELTRAIYTLRTGSVIGRVASTRWYRRLFGGTTGEYAQLIGESRCSPERSDLSRVADRAALWMLFLNYAREALCYAVPDVAAPRSLPGQDEFCSWLEALIAGQST